MRRIAFYAPLKPPNHPVPSGDREMARNLMTALRATGARVDLVSELRIYDGSGDIGHQRRLRASAAAEAARLTAELSQHPVSAWVSYHNYYKSPDLVGPEICRALDLPYVLIEATRAPKRLTGPWAGFEADAEAACDAADAIFYMTRHDHESLDRDRPASQMLVSLRPFLPVSNIPSRAPHSGGQRIFCAGMMRPGDKLASYEIVSETLRCLPDQPWTLDIAGDGPVRGAVAALMAPFGDRVRFLGQLDQAGMSDAYARADLFFWPGVNEAYGMVYLEAQAAGLPVVAQARPGVVDVLATGDYPPPDAGAAALAARIRLLLNDPDLGSAHGLAAQKYVRDHHLLGSAAKTLGAVLENLRAAAS